MATLPASKTMTPYTRPPGPAIHPGVELHNHMLGVVDASYFVDKAAGGSPRRLLSNIDKMFRENEALREEAPDIHRLLEKSNASQAKEQSLDRVRLTLKRVLTATKHTPFDSVYTPRDQLIQNFLHIPDDEMGALLDKFGGAGYKDKMVRAFGAEGLNHQGESLALQQIADAGPDDLRIKGKMSADDALNLKKEITLKRYEIFTEDTVRALHKDNISYSEQSVSLNKLNKQLSPEMIRRVSDKLGKEGIQCDLRFLAMINTSHLSENFMTVMDREKGVPSIFTQKGLDITKPQYERLMNGFLQDGATQSEALRKIANAQPQELEKAGLTPEQARIVTSSLPPQTREGLQQVLRRGDVMGIDIAAPEKEPFTERGMKNFDEMYDLLKAAAQERGRPMALRPHVGEGYPEMKPGMQHFSRYKAAINESSQTPTHYDLAKENLETLISHLEETGYSEKKGQEDGVIIRFGHATHATPQQVARMKTLGVVAEANLTSNVETGALQPKQGGDFFENHSLLNLMYHDVPTILNTDAHGVMHTTLNREYQQADRLIGMYKRNKLPMELPDGRQVYFKELTPEEQAKFDSNRLRAWAEEYGDSVGAGDRLDASRN